MNTKLLMSISAIILGAIGIMLTFVPVEIARSLKMTETIPILFQILGALYFGFALLNWTAKGNLIGGIYSRPVAMSNFAHFIIGGLALIKLVMHDTNQIYMWVLAIVYLLFALLFGYVLFNNPSAMNKAV